ncbi:XRE family transcriptional regulator [Wenjunlia vitaminophila]|uniref:XRE family transcriptional regulator n=1 Tax=Wenjunlia vitaminophila TaxID=76728 RepID=A0A0T6LN01_WENVI|nr:XRE family transcriptional regulator [Wenjunlia vitaminophila]
MTRVDAVESVGGLLREWRNSRRLSQLDLASAAGVSPRYVSLIETGRSRPSADMVLRLAAQLEVPLRHRNRLLVAAGFAPRYRERPLDEPDMSAVRSAVARVLRAHEPYPALVVDRRWNIVMVNAPVEHFLADVDPDLLAAPVNMVRLGFDPRGLASRIVNLAEVRALFRARLSRQVARTGDPVIAALYDEFLAECEPDESVPRPESEVATPMIFHFRGRELRLFSTITTFGTPQDITLDEVSIESYYPADAESADVLRSIADARPASGAPSSSCSAWVDRGVPGVQTE